MKDHFRFKVPKGATSVKILYDAENNRLKADWKVDKPDDKPVDKPEDKQAAKPSVGDHIKSLFTGEGPGAFSDPIDEDDENND